MDKEDNTMKYKYLVICWAPPKSGFELINKHSILENLRKKLKNEVKNEKSAKTDHIDFFIDKFISEYNGMVINNIPVESDEIITDPDKQLLPELQKTIPNIEIISYFSINDSILSIID